MLDVAPNSEPTVRVAAEVVIEVNGRKFAWLEFIVSLLDFIPWQAIFITHSFVLGAAVILAIASHELAVGVTVKADGMAMLPPFPVRGVAPNIPTTTVGVAAFVVPKPRVRVIGWRKMVRFGFLISPFKAF